jgi:predicted nucleic acid-binding protein
MAFLVDTNILLRSAQPAHPLFSQATNAVSRLLRQKQSVFFCAQNIAEFWNVATRPVEVNGLGMSTDEARKEIAAIEASLTLLPDVPEIYAEWKRIVFIHNIQGIKVYDARLAALMMVHSVGNFLTFNAGDFKRFDRINAIHPSLVSS